MPWNILKSEIDIPWSSCQTLDFLFEITFNTPRENRYLVYGTVYYV